MNKENCALKLVDEIIIFYDARSKKHQIVIVQSDFQKMLSPSTETTAIVIVGFIRGTTMQHFLKKLCKHLNNTHNFNPAGMLLNDEGYVSLPKMSTITIVHQNFRSYFQCSLLNTTNADIVCCCSKAKS